MVAARTDPISSYPIPKPSGGTRLMATLSGRDAGTWHQLGGRVALRLEQRLGPGTLANRALIGRSGWRLPPVGSVLRSARRLASVLARASAVVVMTDVAACYPSIRSPVLARSLSRIGVDPSDAHAAADMLDGWGSEGYPGLPIGPEASAVMANAVLLRVDEALGGAPVLRWVDDYLIGAPSEPEAVRLLDRLDVALERVGMRRSDAKTSCAQRGGAFRWLGGSMT